MCWFSVFCNNGKVRSLEKEIRKEKDNSLRILSEYEHDMKMLIKTSRDASLYKALFLQLLSGEHFIFDGKVYRIHTIVKKDAYIQPTRNGRVITEDVICHDQVQEYTTETGWSVTAVEKIPDEVMEHFDLEYIELDV